MPSNSEQRGFMESNALAKGSFGLQDLREVTGKSSELGYLGSPACPRTAPGPQEAAAA